MGIFSRSMDERILTPEERKEISNEKIRKMGISINGDVLTPETNCSLKLKDLDTICKRAIASLIAASFAASIGQGEDRAAIINIHLDILNQFEITGNDMLPKELAILSNNHSKQDLLNVAWSYESYWTLVWALNLITNKEMRNATRVCNVKRAIAIVAGTSEDYDYFKKMCKLRSNEDLLDMLDLYRRYQWACVNNRFNPDICIGKLNPEVVADRARGLEWLTSDVEDWYDIPLA